jgi:hypothetical protein
MLLKELVGEFLPNGSVLWAAVAAEYKRCSGEKDDRDPRDMENIGDLRCATISKSQLGGISF